MPLPQSQNQLPAGSNPYAIPQFTNTGTLTAQQQQLMSLLSQGLTGGGGNLSLDPQATSSYIQKSVAAPLMQQYQQTIMPQINDAYASVGALLGSRRGFAQQQALAGLQTTIAQQLGQAQLSNQQQRAQLAANVIAQPQMAIQPYVPIAANAGSGFNVQLPNQGGTMNNFNGLKPVFANGGNRGWNQGNGYQVPTYNPPAPPPEDFGSRGGGTGGISFSDILSGNSAGYSGLGTSIGDASSSYDSTF